MVYNMHKTFGGELPDYGTASRPGNNQHSHRLGKPAPPASPLLTFIFQIESRMIRERHCSIQTLFTTQHALPVQHLEARESASTPQNCAVRTRTSIFRACQPTPLLTFPLESASRASSILSGCSSGRSRRSTGVSPLPVTQPLAVSTYHPRPPLLRTIRQEPAPAPRLPRVLVASSITRSRVGGC
jgi:hypothetical protein